MRVIGKGHALLKSQGTKTKRALTFAAVFVAGIVLLCFSVFMVFVLFPMSRAVEKDFQVKRLQKGSSQDPIEYIDPFWGTGGWPLSSGMLAPSVSSPYGLMRVGPDTARDSDFFQWFDIFANIGTSGYYYHHPRLLGFSHFRLYGTGVKEGGVFRVIPVTSSDELNFWRSGVPYKKSSEKGSPSHYQISRDGVDVNLTANKNLAAHLYRFSSMFKGIIIDGGSSIGDGRVYAKEFGSLKKVVFNEKNRMIQLVTEIRGGFSKDRRFFATFLLPFWPKKIQVMRGDDSLERAIFLDFTDREKPLDILLLAGLSQLNIDQTEKEIKYYVEDAAYRNNVIFERFNLLKNQNKESWRRKINRITINSQEPGHQLFFTALFNVFRSPTRSDEDSHFLPVLRSSREIHSQALEAGSVGHYTDLSLWDTSRGALSLLSLLDPTAYQGIMQSIVRMAGTLGHLPRWPAGTTESYCMIGSPATIALAEALIKGVAGVDREDTVKLLADDSRGTGLSIREAGKACHFYGYCPADSINQSVSRTLEYAAADGAIFEVASHLKDKALAEEFGSKAKSYVNLWDKEGQFFRPRRKDGSWVKPVFLSMTTFMDTLIGGIFTEAYTEGSPSQWRWYVPHSPKGLFELFSSGSRDFVEELEQFMGQATASRGALYPGAGYWHGNEQSFHVPYLFIAAGKPERTQFWVRWILENRYGEGPAGLDGNDDAGALSAWYVWSALGIFPQSGSDRYWLTTPMFSDVDVSVGHMNRLLKIRTDAPNSRPMTYIKSVTWNGTRLCEPILRHSDLLEGGTLHFSLSDQPEPGGGFLCSR